MCSDAFGCVQMQPDAFRCAGMRSDTSENFRIFSIFSNDFGECWSFFDLRGLLLLMFYVQGITFIGANYWEVALVDFRIQIKPRKRPKKSEKRIHSLKEVRLMAAAGKWRENWMGIIPDAKCVIEVVGHSHLFVRYQPP